MARPFRFRLQPLLDLRRRAEQQKRHAYELARRRRDENLSDLDSFYRMLGDRVRQSGNAVELAQLDALITARRRLTQSVDAALERARGELVEASRERRVLDKLRERRKRAYDVEQARCEEMEIDEGNAMLQRLKVRG